MSESKETPHVTAVDVVTGHFIQGNGYYAYRSRGTDDWLLIHTLSGRGRFGWSGAEINSEPGDWVLIKPRTPHDYGVEPTLQRWELLWAHFNPRREWHDLLTWPALAPGLMRLRLPDDEQARIVNRFFDVYRLANGPLRNRSSLAMNALEEVLLRCDEHNPTRNETIDPRIRAAMDTMCEKLAQPLPISVLAQVAGLSDSRFSHLFRQSVGMTPQQYHEQRRMARARQLLEMTSMPVKSISHELGFENPFYFTRRFTLHAKCNPRDYRRRQLAASKRPGRFSLQ
jgi:AraC family transcriptional regulator of arabinose operon